MLVAPPQAIPRKHQVLPQVRRHSTTLFLENYLTAYKNEKYSDSSIHVQTWELDWINSTSARLQFTELNKTTNRTVNADETFVVFPTTQDAKNYVNAMNLAAYRLASTEYTGRGHQNVKGHAPQICIDYMYNERNPFNISEYKLTISNNSITSL